MKAFSNHLSCRIRFQNWVRASGLAALVGSCLSCTPQTEEEKAFFERRAQEREVLESITADLQGSTRYAEAMDLVKKGKAPDGKGTVEDWAEKKAGNRALFPRWAVLPKGADKYEVRYEYTLMGENYDLERKGYAWTVNLMVKIISPHRELSDKELHGGKDSRLSRISRKQPAERHKEEAFSLE